MADNLVGFGFPHEVAPSEALRIIADAFAAPGDEILTTAQGFIFAATLRDLAWRVGTMELSLGFFRGEAIYEPANDTQPPLYGNPGGN